MDLLRALPDTLTPGDSYDIQLTVPGYPATAGWVLSWSLSGPGRLDVESAANGADHVLTVLPAMSGALAAGTYGSQLRATNAGTNKARVLQVGTVVVDADLSRFAPGENATPAQWDELIRACDAALLAMVTGGAMSSYMVAGRQVMFKTADEVRRVRAWAEGKRARQRRGSAFGRVRVTLSRGW